MPLANHHLVAGLIDPWFHQIEALTHRLYLFGLLRNDCHILGDVANTVNRLVTGLIPSAMPCIMTHDTSNMSDDMCSTMLAAGSLSPGSARQGCNKHVGLKAVSGTIGLPATARPCPVGYRSPIELYGTVQKLK